LRRKIKTLGGAGWAFYNQISLLLFYGFLERKHPDMASLEIERMYWLPYCSTCTKAEQHLLSKGTVIHRYINVKETPVSREELLELAEGVGGVENLFSKRAMKYRAWGLHEKTLSDDDMLKYMQEEYTFIKRPVIVAQASPANDKMAKGKKVLAGFSAKQYDLLLTT
jgi:arsenate reductase